MAVATKKVPTILRDNSTKNIAVRSDALIEARYSLTAKQNELLDMLLCEIKKDDNVSYTIAVDKYKSLYEKDTSNLYRDLKKAAKEFEGKGFRVINKDTKEEIFYTWFSKIHYKPKLGEISVNVDKDFKELLWNIKKKVRYDIKNTLNFNSSYSQRMYMYLKSFEDTGWRRDRFEDLLYKLECPKSYNKFSDFKRAVLDISFDEINNKSDIEFTYEVNYRGRSVETLMFYIKRKPSENGELSGITVRADKKLSKKAADNNTPMNQQMQFNLADENTPKYIEAKSIEIMEEEIENTDNNTPLILNVRKFIKEKVSDEDIKALLKEAKNDLELIEKVYSQLRQQKIEVPNIIGWMRIAIRAGGYGNNIKYVGVNENTDNFTPKEIKKDRFNGYENQREYDMDKVEKAFAGQIENIKFEDLLRNRNN